MIIRAFLVTALLSASTALVSAADKLDLVGSWDTKTKMENGDITEAKIVITADGDKLSGVVHRNGEETKLKSISTEGTKVSFALDLNYQDTDIDYSVKAEGSDRSLTGTWVASDSSGTELATGDWTGSKAETPASLVGRWNSVATTNEGDELPSVATFSANGDSFSGDLKGKSGTIKLTDIEVKGMKVQFDMVFPYEGQDIDIRIKAEQKEADVLDGKWIAFDSDGSEAASGLWRAKRAADQLALVGEWATVATTDDGSEMESVFHFSKTDDKLSGHSESDNGKLEFEVVKVSDNKMTVEMELPYDGNTLDVRITAESKDDADKLAGKWVVFDDAGQEAATGDWKADRKASK